MSANDVTGTHAGPHAEPRSGPRTGPRVRAPELIGADWLNTDAPLTLKGLRGRFVLLDFWTSCCGNCLHVLDELRPFEDRYADVVTVIGVHSPKFPHEAELPALRAAVARYEVHHPVLNDPGLQLWQQYAVRAWPTLVLIDPEGYIVAQAAGEGQVSALAAQLDELIIEHDTRGTLRRGTGPYQPPPLEAGALRYPAKAIVLPAARTGRAYDSLLVADAGHHQLVELELDGVTVLRRIGSGARGEPFAEPNGLTLLPTGTTDYDVLVADTANHVLRGVRLADGAVVTTIDLPRQLQDARTVTGPVPAVVSPWDAVWWPARGRVVVAAAGVHLLLEVDPCTHDTRILAGTTVEGLGDGSPLDAWLAQPSGLAVDGDRLWFVDAETSALRHLDAGTDLITTVIGEGLFDFGHVDGAADAARLQHPLGVTVLPDHSVAILDTYNGAVRRYDPVAREVTTIARDLAEPSGGVVVDGQLVVVESAAHALVRPVPASLRIDGRAQTTQRPTTDVAAGDVVLRIAFTPPSGRKLDARYGPSTSLSITATPPELLPNGAGESSELTRTIRLAPGHGVLQVTAQAASCDDDPDIEHPACYLARQDWGIPIEVGSSGDRELVLTLLG